MNDTVAQIVARLRRHVTRRRRSINAINPPPGEPISNGRLKELNQLEDALREIETDPTGGLGVELVAKTDSGLEHCLLCRFSRGFTSPKTPVNRRGDLIWFCNRLDAWVPATDTFHCSFYDPEPPPAGEGQS